MNTSKICIFKGTETGLVLDNEHVANDTSLDLNNAGVRAGALIDRNNDVTLDLYLLGEGKEYWIEVGATDGPKFEEFDYDNTILADQTITAMTAFDFDSDANEDIVMTVNDNNGSGRFITVPKSGDGTNWAEAQAYENIPTLKSLQTIVYDQDTDIDVFVMGDENPSNGIDLSANSVLRIYETGEVNILENIVDIDFTKQSTSSLSRHVIYADYDTDFD